MQKPTATDVLDIDQVAKHLNIAFNHATFSLCRAFTVCGFDFCN